MEQQQQQCDQTWPVKDRHRTASLADADQTGNSGLALSADLEQEGIFHLVYSEQAEEMGVGGSAGTRMNTELSDG